MINEESADISMSASSFDENIVDGSVVATLSTSDQDSGDTHTYALVSGEGDADNMPSSLTLNGNSRSLSLALL